MDSAQSIPFKTRFLAPIRDLALPLLSSRAMGETLVVHDERPRCLLRDHSLSTASIPRKVVGADPLPCLANNR